MHVKLSQEDKSRFASEILTAKPHELLQVIAFIEDYKNKFTDKDLKFMHSHIGRRAERLLRNVTKNFSFDDERSENGK